MDIICASLLLFNIHAGSIPAVCLDLEFLKAKDTFRIKVNLRVACATMQQTRLQLNIDARKHCASWKAKQFPEAVVILKHLFHFKKYRCWIECICNVLQMWQ